MIARPRRLTTFGLIALPLLGGCGARNYWEFTPRPVTDAPAQFATDARPGGPGCRATLTDPRDDTRLQLFRSSAVEGRNPVFVGDYLVTPAGKYGVGAGQLLRVDCDHRRAMGVVDRS